MNRPSLFKRLWRPRPGGNLGRTRNAAPAFSSDQERAKNTEQLQMLCSCLLTLSVRNTKCWVVKERGEVSVIWRLRACCSSSNPSREQEPFPLNRSAPVSVKTPPPPPTSFYLGGRGEKNPHPLVGGVPHINTHIFIHDLGLWQWALMFSHFACDFLAFVNIIYSNVNNVYLWTGRRSSLAPLAPCRSHKITT